MTQVWRDGKVLAITRVQAGPCVVTQVKESANDGYNAVQLGFGIRKEKNIKKPQKGHLKDLDNVARLREFRTEEGLEIKRGDKVDASTFEIGDKLNVTGITKGRGFQGVVKRHGFAGQITTHGTKDQVRMPGSAGATGPAHVFKGQRMPGRMGTDRVTTTNLNLIDIDLENNILSIEGSIPGHINGYLLIKTPGDLKINNIKEVKKEEVKEEVKEEQKKEEVKKEVKE